MVIYCTVVDGAKVRFHNASTDTRNSVFMIGIFYVGYICI
jgi:hypothetical protein